MISVFGSYFPRYHPYVRAKLDVILKAFSCVFWSTGRGILYHNIVP